MGARRDWQAHLTPWEAVQVECLKVARAHINYRLDPASKRLAGRLAKIRNRACHRARYAAGIRQDRGGSKACAPSRAVQPSANGTSKHQARPSA